MKANGWPITTLGDVCEFQRGLTYSKSDEVELSDNVVLRATNIDLNTNLLNLDELRYISDDVAVPAAKKVKLGSLMVCTASGSKSHLGKIAYIDQDYGYAFGGFMGMITPTAAIFPRYLFHLLTSGDYKDFIDGLADGANINNLKFDDLKRFPVPVPPLPEQQRIVGILDEAFAGIATAKANAEKNLRNVDAFLDKLIEQAALGRLTEDFRPPASRGVAAEDFIKLQQEIEALNYKTNRKSEPTKGRDTLQAMLPKNWVLVAIDQIFRLIDYRGKTPKKTATGKRLITAKNIKRGYLSDEPIEHMSDEAYKKWMVRGYPKPGDIFFVTEGHTMGFAAINDRSDQFALAQRTITLQPISPLNTKFFLYFVLSQPFQKLVRSNATGAAAVGMKGSKLRSLPLAFPSNAEQQRIVSILDAAQSGVERLRAIYQRKLAALDALKKSLLHQAFSGQLTGGAGHKPTSAAAVSPAMELAAHE